LTTSHPLLSGSHDCSLVQYTY